MTSTIKVNTIQDSCGSSLVAKCGANITLGASGKTVRIACGASTVGMGRSGTVDWCSTIYTNSPGTVTGVSGKGYFLNTTSGQITINLPSSPSVGDIIAVKDYAGTFDSNKVTIGRGGSKIGGECIDAELEDEGQSVMLVYADATKGWINVNTDTEIKGSNFIVASGGNTTITCGNFKTHIFTSDGTFSVSKAGQPGGSTTLDYAVIAGGGAGGQVSYGGGGGAGGFRLSNSPTNSIPAPTMSPLVNSTGITASVGSYPITVGGGGSAPAPGTTNAGSNSVFSTITSAGGGTGRVEACKTDPAMDGGSGAGGSADGPALYKGCGNTPPVSPPQGNNGGESKNSPYNFGGGGGGAGAVGFPGTPGPTSGHGGCGSFIADAVFGPTAPSYGTPGPVSSTRYFAGGGGGGSNANTPYPGTPAPGKNGGGNGGVPGFPGQPGYVPGGQAGTAGTANTGSGGGGGGYGPSPVNAPGAGGSGIVLIRYKFQ
jgi:hypothetical protein